MSKNTKKLITAADLEDIFNDFNNDKIKLNTFEPAKTT